VEFSLALIPLTAIGCGTAIILTIIDKVSGGRRKAAQLEANAAKERARLLEAQLIDARRQNELLQKQLEWHTKMLETQDRLMKQLADGESAHSRVGSVP
jgi:hypothetical protein